MILMECVVDVFFIIDIILTFFSAFEKHQHMEIRHSKLAIAYLKFWFWIDLISAFPYQVFELGLVFNNTQVEETEEIEIGIP